MARKYKPEVLEQIYKTVEAHPGARPAFIARVLGQPRSQVTRRLPALEDQGYLLSEDEKGGLWPFSARKPG